jgi:hypothetical protein
MHKSVGEWHGLSATNYNGWMRIGIISDTHGQGPMMGAAVHLLLSRGAGYLLHCGDVGSAGVLDHLAGLKAGFVWGNCDWERMALQHYAEKIGVPCYGAFGDLTIEGKRIALMHGDDDKLKRKVLDGQGHDFLFQGHTHIREEQRIGRVHLVNPGALFRAREKTVALVDSDSGRVEFLVVQA